MTGIFLEITKKISHEIRRNFSYILDPVNNEQTANHQPMVNNDIKDNKMDTTEPEDNTNQRPNTKASISGNNLEGLSVPVSTANSTTEEQNIQIPPHFSLLDAKDKYRLHHSLNFATPAYYIDWSQVIFKRKKMSNFNVCCKKNSFFFLSREVKEDGVIMFGH